MQQRCTQADYRLLEAVQSVSVLTAAQPAESARKRLRGIVGYRLYRSLVGGRRA